MLKTLGECVQRSFCGSLKQPLKEILSECTKSLLGPFPSPFKYEFSFEPFILAPFCSWLPFLTSGPGTIYSLHPLSEGLHFNPFHFLALFISLCLLRRYFNLNFHFHLSAEKLPATENTQCHSNDNCCSTTLRFFLLKVKQISISFNGKAERTQLLPLLTVCTFTSGIT